MADTSETSLAAMLSGDNRWVAMATCWSIGERGMTELRDRIEALVECPDAALGDVARRALSAWNEDQATQTTLTEVEKALKLRSVDVLKQAAGEDLAYVAQIASEVTIAAGEVIYREDEAPDALYVVIDGEVELYQGDIDIGLAEAGEAFGSWALVDDAPRVASARAKTEVRLLKVAREDFTDLLADRPDIVQAVFKAMVGRIRSLAALATATGANDD